MRIGFFLLSILFILNISIGYCQGPPPDPDCPVPPCAPIPIDGGLGLLIVSGVIYGTNKIRKTYKSE